MTRPTHAHSSLAKTIAGAAKAGTPLRHARGVVVSSNQGQTTLTLDGGSTHIQAFNYDHAQNLSVGTVVDVLLVGNQAYVLGAYSDPWTPWAPTFNTTGGGTPAFGNGTVTARYMLTGKTCTVRFHFVYGTTSNGGLGPWEIGLPFTAANDVEQHLSCKVYTGATGQDWYGGALIQANTDFVLPEAALSSSTPVTTFVQNSDGSGGTGTGVPLVSGAYTFNAGSNLSIYGTYEIA